MGERKNKLKGQVDNKGAGIEIGVDFWLRWEFLKLYLTAYQWLIVFEFHNAGCLAVSDNFETPIISGLG